MSSSIGFPVIGRTTINDDEIVVAHFRSTGPGSTWCGREMSAGSTLIYGPGSEHTAVSRENTSFDVAVISVDRIVEHGDQHGLDLRLPWPGSVTHLPAATTMDEGGRKLGQPSFPGADVSLQQGTGERVLAAVANLLQHGRQGGRRRSIDSRHIVRIATEHADAAFEAPSVADLCLVAHVSERRLRQAFVESLGFPPSQYLRLRQLSRIRDELEVQEPGQTTVSTVATRAGVRHLSRFSRRYAETYDELPSETLSRPAHNLVPA